MCAGLTCFQAHFSTGSPMKDYLSKRVKGLFPALSRVVDRMVETSGFVGIVANPAIDFDYNH